MNAHVVPIETRSDPNPNQQQNEPDPVVAATQAVEELRTAAGAFETRQTEALRAAEARLAAVEVRLNRPGAQQQEQRNEPAPEVRAFGVYLRRGAAALNADEQRALTVANDQSAGYLAPPEYGNEILRTVVEYSPIRAYARVMTIAGSEIRYPKRLTSTNAQWVAELEDRPESTLTYGQVTLAPHEIATWVDVSKQLLEDAAYDVEGELRSAFAEDFGVKEGAAFVNGDGVGKPRGILQDAGIAEFETGEETIKPGELIALLAKLPSVHAQRGAWAMNRNTLTAIRLMTDVNGAFLWQPGLQAGQPASLLGRPIIEAVDMPDISTLR